MNLSQIIVTKRNMSKVSFDGKKIAIAIKKGFDSIENNLKYTEADVNKVYNKVLTEISKKKKDASDLKIKVEEIQDIIEGALKDLKYTDVYENFSTYRENMKKRREVFEDRKEYKFLKILENLQTNKSGYIAKLKLMDYGKEITKQIAITKDLKRKHEELHRVGEIYIHGLEYLSLGLSAFTQIDLSKLFNEGYFTMYGEVTKANGITAQSHLASNILQLVCREQYYGESVPAFDKFLSEGVLYTFKSIFKQILFDTLQLIGIFEFLPINSIEREIAKIGSIPINVERFNIYLRNSKELENIFEKVYILSMDRTRIQTEKAMEAFVHNINTPILSENNNFPNYTLNLGTDTSEMGRMVTKALFKAIDDGLAYKKKPKYPEIVFKIKKGINLNKEDKNYDLFEWAQRLNLEKIYFSNLDSKNNAKFLKEGDYSTEVAYLDGIRTIENNIADNREISFGRGLLFNTSINLVRLGLKHGIKQNGKFMKKEFFSDLEQLLQQVKNELNSRFIIACEQKPNEYLFLYKQNLWLDSDKIKEDDKLRRAMKNGIIGISIVGGYELALAICGEISEKAKKLIEEILLFIDSKCIEFSDELCLNFQLLGLNETMNTSIFIDLDTSIYGKIKEITNKEKYTYSISLPQKFELLERIKWESSLSKYLKAGGYLTITENELLKKKMKFEEIFDLKELNKIDLIKLEKEN